MAPYFDKNGITLYHGDCREVLPQLGVMADMVLADPPYGETSIEWDRWPERWVSSLQSVSSRSTSLWCFGSMRMFFANLGDFSFWRFVQDVVWEKHNGSGFMVDRFRRVHESALHFVPVGAPWDAIYKSPRFTADATKRTVRRKEKPAHWTGARGPSSYESIDGGPRMMRSVIYVRSCHGQALHPTQKPTSILEPLIEYSCPPDGLMIVPFAGCGSELLAAKQSGRRAIGVEIDEQYCERACKRFEQQVMQFTD